MVRPQAIWIVNVKMPIVLLTHDEPCRRPLGLAMYLSIISLNGRTRLDTLTNSLHSVKYIVEAGVDICGAFGAKTWN